MEINRIWTEASTPNVESEGVLAFAIHDGHQVRKEVADLLALSDQECLREEDPFTGRWTKVASMQFVGLVSRFQVDLNRPRESAVYRVPDDAWGLKVWKRDLPEDVYQRSLIEYDTFYAAMETMLTKMQERFGRFVILDLHSYNHRRGGRTAPPADPVENPQVNIGTGTVDKSLWKDVVDDFMKDLRAFDFPGGKLDVRENVKFRGGHFSRWVHTNFPTSACVIAVEFKKFFMDEWSGEPDEDIIAAIQQALRSTVPGIKDKLRAMPHAQKK